MKEKPLTFTTLANFQDKQKEAWFTLMKPECKYLLYGGAAGGGKSYFIRWSAIGLAMYLANKYNIQNLPIGLFSEDYPTLRDRQVTRINTEIPPYIGSIRETQIDGLCFYMNREYGGAKIMLRNLDDPSKYASVEFAAILVEELTKNVEQKFEDLRNRLRYPGVEERKFVGATNPGEIGHEWVKRRWVYPDGSDPEQERFFFIKSLYTDNKYNPQDYNKQLSAIKDPQKRKALMEGDWNIFAGQFFSEFREGLHTVKPFKPKRDFIKVGGIDWGYTAPFCMLCSFVQDVRYEEKVFKRIWTYKEFYGVEQTPRTWASEIKNLADLSRFAYIESDPSMWNKKNDGSRSIASDFIEIWQDNGFKLKKSNNKRQAGWARMRDWLSIAPDGLPYWMITEDCVNLRRELANAIRSDLDPEDVNTLGSDHALDAARYMQSRLKWVDAADLGVAQEKRLISGITPSYKSYMNLDKWANVKTQRGWKER